MTVAELTRELRFQEITRASSLASLKPEEAYQRLRAEVVLGNYDLVETALTLDFAHWRSPLGLYEKDLLQFQIHGFRRTNLSKNSQALKLHLQNSAALLEDHPYLHAEHELSLGYFSATQSKFREALGHYERAQQLYLVSDHLGHAGIAHFNAGTCANHLGLHALRDRHFASLKSLGALFTVTYGQQVLEAFHTRAQAYLALDTDNLALAQDLWTNSAASFAAMGRARDWQGAQSFLAYLALKQESLDHFEFLFAEWSHHPAPKDSLVNARLQAFRDVANQPIMTLSLANALLKKWRSASLESVSFLMALDLVLEALVRARAFGDVISFYSRIKALPERFEQMPWLIDFRYFVILALYALGSRSEANYLIGAYESDARLSHSQIRLDKVRAVRDLWNVPQLSRGDTLSTHQSIIIDFAAKKLLSGDKTTDLSRYPLILKMLRALAEHAEGVDFEKLFEICYGRNFDTYLHQSRFHSLIARVRAMLGDSSAILWKDGNVRFSSAHHIEFVSSPRASSEKKEERQSKILALLRTSKHSATPAHLAKLCGGAKRTLQLDLKELCAARLIERRGKGKNTVYVLKKELV